LSRLTWSQRSRKLAGGITQRKACSYASKEWKQEAADWVVKHTLASGSREVCQDLLGHKEAGSLLVG
jgi:hypothetical protein